MSRSTLSRVALLGAFPRSFWLSSGSVAAPAPGQAGAAEAGELQARGAVALGDGSGLVDADVPDAFGLYAIRVRDIGRVELGASDYALRSLLDNKSAVAIPISQ